MPESKPLSSSISDLFACPSYTRLLRRWLFCSPYVRTCALLVPQRLPLPGLAWTSETDETIGDTLSFGLAGYFTVTEMQLRFPVGDTYKFDLALFNGLDGTGEAYVTISVRFSHVFFCSSFVWKRLATLPCGYLPTSLLRRERPP